MPEIVSIESRAKKEIERITNERMPELYLKKAEVYEMQAGIMSDIIDLLNGIYFKEVGNINTKPLIEQIGYLSKEVGDTKKLAREMRSQL